MQRGLMKQRIVQAATEEGGVVVVDRQREAHPIDARGGRGSDADDPVGTLPRSDLLGAGRREEYRLEDAVPERARGVARAPGRESEIVGASWTERGLAGQRWRLASGFSPRTAKSVA